MAYQQSPPYAQQHQQQPDVVSGDQYRYALTNFRIAHEKVEQQRKQLEEQESQVAQLRSRIALLEGGSNPAIGSQNGNTVDDFSIKNSASQLDKLINRWAADVIRAPPVSLPELCASILNDVVSGLDVSHVETTPMQVQSYLRHAMAETVSEGIINCLIVTNSTEANIQLTRIHEHIFARDPTVASVWRRQTFSAAVDTCTPDMSLSILYEQIPELMKALNGKIPASGGVSILESAYAFRACCMLLDRLPTTPFTELSSRSWEVCCTPRQIELVKRCLKSERGETDRVGATIFPGLVKVSRVSTVPGMEETIQTVVRRAQVICECAMGGSAVPTLVPYDPQQQPYEPQQPVYDSQQPAYEPQQPAYEPQQSYEPQQADEYPQTVGQSPMIGGVQMQPGYF